MTRPIALMMAAALLGCGSGAPADACTCPADRSVECSGVATPVTVSAAASVCNGANATSDAPTAFPVGRTDVHFSGGSASCTQHVTITDTVAPTFAGCAPPGPLVRTTRGAALTPPTATAKDTCSTAVSVTPSPATLTGRGPQSITYVATDGSGNHSSCTASVTIYNAFAASALRLVHAALTPTGDTATTIVWEHPLDSDTDSYRIERAASASGPWSSLGTTTPDHPRFDDAALADPQTWYRVVSTVKGLDGAATDPIRALAVSATEYDLGAQKVPGLTLPANGSEPTTHAAPIHGYVRRPVDLSAGPFPLVLLLHGNHGNCRPPDYDFTGVDPNHDDGCIISNTNTCPAGSTPAPSAQGLSWLAESLAARGYVVASVDANAINCRQQTVSGRFDGFIGPRADLLIEHLRRWRAWATTGAAPFDTTFVGHVDVTRSLLFGHSRGAEAVAEVPQTLPAATDVAGIGLGAVFSLAPTNFDDAQPGTAPFATLVPMCDGDVYTYTGVQLYDRTLRSVGRTTQSVQLWMNHADHNHFNTEWRFDDNAMYVPSCAAANLGTPGDQQRVLEVVVASWFDEVLAPGATLEPWLKASGDLPASLLAYTNPSMPLDLRRSYSNPQALLIDNFEGGDPTHDKLGGVYMSSGALTDSTPSVCTGVSAPACEPNFSSSIGSGSYSFRWPHHNPSDASHVRSALALDWNASTALVKADFAAGSASFDASSYAALSLRVASRAASTTAGRTAPIDFSVAIVDAAGHRASANVSEVTTIPYLYDTSYPRSVLQTVRFSLAGLSGKSSPAVDLHTLVRLELATSVAGDEQGSVLVTDVELTQ